MDAIIAVGTTGVALLLGSLALLALTHSPLIFNLAKGMIILSACAVAWAAFKWAVINDFDVLNKLLLGGATGVIVFFFVPMSWLVVIEKEDLFKREMTAREEKAAREAADLKKKQDEEERKRKEKEEAERPRPPKFKMGAFWSDVEKIDEYPTFEEQVKATDRKITIKKRYTDRRTELFMGYEIEGDPIGEATMTVEASPNTVKLGDNYFGGTENPWVKVFHEDPMWLVQRPYMNRGASYRVKMDIPLDVDTVDLKINVKSSKVEKEINEEVTLMLVMPDTPLARPPDLH